MDHQYIIDSLRRCLIENKDSEYPLAIQLRGDIKSTKWLHIDVDVVDKIIDLLEVEFRNELAKEE
jgi:hypothetical protein